MLLILRPLSKHFGINILLQFQLFFFFFMQTYIKKMIFIGCSPKIKEGLFNGKLSYRWK